MDKAYIYLARSLIEIALKEMISRYAKIGWLSGWPISFIAIVFSPILGHMISRSILNLDFELIKSKVSGESKKYFDFYKNLKQTNTSKLSDIQKEALIAQAKKITKRFLSAKQYLK